MSQTPDVATGSISTAEPSADRHDHTGHPPARLYQTLAWVGIVAGVVFTVAVIFFSGMLLGRASGGYHGWHRGNQGGQMGQGGSMGDCPMMRPGGMGPGGMGPGGMGPGGKMGPDDMGPGGMMKPDQAPPPPKASALPTP